MSTTALTKVGTKNAEQVVLLDAAGDQVTSFGGGTQYADGAAAATPTGTQINWNDGGTQRAVSAAKPLPVTASIDTTGLATSTIQTDGTQKTQIVDSGGEAATVTGGKLDVNASIDTTGLATAANQQTDALTDTELRATPVPVSATDLDIRNLTATDVVTANLSATDNAVLDSIDTSTAAINTKTPALGQALAAASVPVVLPAAQITTLTPPAAITGFALEATLGSVKTAVETIDNFISGSRGLVTEDNSAAIKTSVELIDDTVATTASAIPSKGIAVSGTDGTNARVLKTDTSGELQVDVLTMPTVTVTATNLDVQSGGVDLATSTQAGAIQTAVELIDDTVKVLGTDTYTEATSKGVVMGAVRRDADTTLVNTTNEFGPIQMDARGFVKTEVFSGETLPVSLTSTTVTGTVAVTQSGTWDEVGINDSGNSITVDAPVGTPAFVRLSDGASAISTLPVSLASVPSHPVTNAGVFAVQVDGAALTSLQLADDVVATLGTTTYTEASTKGTTIGAVRRDADTTLVDTTNEIGPLQMDANGRLKVEVFSGETLPVSGTVTANLAAGTNNIGDVDILSIAAGDNNIGNVDVVTVPADPFGANADAAATAGSTGSIQAKLRLVTSQLDSIKTAVETLDNTVGGTELQVDVVGALPAGTNAIGKLAANSGVDIGDVDVTSVIAGTGATNLGKAEDAAHTTGDTGVAVLERRIDTAATSADTSGDYATANQSAEGASWATLTPTTTSGLSVANFTSGDTYTALTNSAQVIKATAGNLYGYYIYNPNATAAYVMVYNTAAASVTVGTTTPILVFAIPATAAANLMFPYPITFSNAGWSCAAATTGGGNTAPSTALEVMFWYK